MTSVLPHPAKPISEWRNFAGVHARLRPPLRPAPSDVAAFRAAIEGSDARVLLLGVTPELSVLGAQLTAVDNSPRMLARVWPGDRAGRRAMLGDWSALPFEDGAFDAVIGDGSLNSAPGQLQAIFGEIGRVLAPGGKAVFRLFASPETPETLEGIASDVTDGWGGNVHALKWRIAMALAAREPDAIVAVRDILAAFDRLFPDRASLAAQTGWGLEEIDTLDAYLGADHSLAFPTASRMIELASPYFSDTRVLDSHGYPLAERCPTVVWTARLK